MRLFPFAVILIFGSNALAFTGATTENFTGAQQFNSTASTAVWNIVANRIQPPLTVCLSSPAPGCYPNTESYDVDIGTGSDGVFDTPTYANFGTISHGSGNAMILTINTNTHPYFNFTTFNLPSNWTIQGAGTNALWFKVQGSFTNAGTITCQGGNGGNSTADITVGGAGGIGVCAGENGGLGGYANPSQVDGASGGDGGLGGGNTHGSGGVCSTMSPVAANGGGGGGTYGAGGTTSTGGTGGTSGGSGGSSSNDYILANFGSTGFGPGSGSGGGGGGAYLHNDIRQGSGGGGGAGGGNIHIACGGDFYQPVGAVISVSGGNGGNGVGGIYSGPGGGGGGGTIIIHTGGNITDHGSVLAIGGSAGIPGGGGTAGAGGTGRSWITSLGTFTDGVGEDVGFGGPSQGGEVHYKLLSSYSAQSLGYDSLNTSPTFTSFGIATSLPGTSTATLTVAGSNDNFVSDNTGFVALTNTSALAGKRFFRFNVQMQLTPPAMVSATTPVTVNTFTANYTGLQQNTFQFSPACGNFGGPGEFLFDMFLCWFAGFISNGRLRKNTPWRRSKNSRSSSLPQ